MSATPWACITRSGRKYSPIKGGVPNHPWIDSVANHPQVENLLGKVLNLAATPGGWRHRSDFQRVRKFCLFVGHPRSGHSLIGSLLDAHPQIVIAHELHALESIRTGASKPQLFYQILERSRWFSRRGGEWDVYKYDVPSQHKGEFTTLRVIGDKKGGASTTDTPHPFGGRAEFGGFTPTYPNRIAQLGKQ